LQAVRIRAPAKRCGRHSWIGQDGFKPVGDRSRDLLHRSRFGHEDRLKQGHWNQQHLAARLGDEIRRDWGAGYQRQFIKRVTGLQSADRLPSVAVTVD
jgi:hypothetical protein